MERLERLERVGVNANFVMNGVWCVPVHVIGTAGTLARYGFALTDNEGEFWAFQEEDLESVLEWEQNH